MKCKDFCESRRHGLKAAMERRQIFWKERLKRDDCGSVMTGGHAQPTSRPPPPPPRTGLLGRFGQSSAELSGGPLHTIRKTSWTISLCYDWKGLRGALKQSVCRMRTWCPSSQFRVYSGQLVAPSISWRFVIWFQRYTSWYTWVSPAPLIQYFWVIV